MIYCLPCADPEKFVSGGQTFFLYFLYFFWIKRKRIQIALKADRHRPASETPFKWRFAGGPMMAPH